MGRGKARGRKLARATSGDHGSSDEEKMPARKRRGRLQKSLKEEIDEDEMMKIEEDEHSEEISFVQAKHKARPASEKTKNEEKVEQGNGDNENGIGIKSSTEESNKGNGFRQNSGRRKSKPRRAAEAVVECN